MATCPKCLTPIADSVERCGICGSPQRGVFNHAEDRDSLSPLPMAVGSLVLFIVLLFALAMGVASCWGGCSHPGPTLLLLLISAFGTYVSLQGFRLAVKSSGGTAVISFLLLVPGALLSIPTFLGTTIGLATALVKNLVKLFT